MNSNLSDFIRDNYEDYKADFFSAFIVRCSKLSKQNGRLGFLTPYVWMFILSYEKLRKYILGQKTLTSLIQFEYSAFEEAIVPICTFTFCNTHIERYIGSFLRLTEFRGGMEVQRIKTLEAIEDKTCGYYYETRPDDCLSLPNSPIAFWQGESFFRVFQTENAMSSYVDVRKGMTTSDNNVYLRFWWEVAFENTNISLIDNPTWFKTHKGGEFRRWFGNSENLVNWGNDGFALKSFPKSVIRNEDYYFRECISWNDISSAKAAFRYVPVGSISNASGPSFYGSTTTMLYLMGLCNSIVAEDILTVLCPTIHFEIGQIAKVPVCYDKRKENVVVELVKQAINKSRSDWDSFETSWDFLVHPLVLAAEVPDLNGGHKVTLADSYKKWEALCEKRFNQLKANEEELNRIFIDIYGLQDELTPEVEDKDVTVRKADLGRDIRSLLSYAVGCMFGRYSLNEPGLVYAGGEWDSSKYSTFIPDKDNCIPITDEAYFEDDLVGQFVGWMKKAFGEENLEANLDFIAKTLGNKGATSREVIRNYFLNDFMKDHFKIYQKRPIYWLFDSGKQNGFKALVYMHRWNADTVGNLRVEYLHRMQHTYEREIVRMQETIDNSRDSREVSKATKRKDKLQKQLKEAKDYDAMLAHIALSRIEIDLDDGVKVNYEKVQTGRDGKKMQILAKV